MPIQVTCPSCGRSGRVPDSAAGKMIQCPACGRRYRLPETESNDPGFDLIDDAPAAAAPPRPRAVAPPSPSRQAAASRAPAANPASPAGLARTPAATARRPAVDDSDATTGLSRDVIVALIAGGGFLGMVLIGGVILLATRGGSSQQKPSPSTPTARVSSERPSDPEPAPSPVVEKLATTERSSPASTNPAPSELATPQPSFSAAASPVPGSVAATEPEFVVLARSAAAKAAAERPPDRADTLSTADIVEACEPSVALVKGKGSLGTGFLIGPGLLATNAHVIEDEPISGLEIRFASAHKTEQQGPFKAELLYEDPKRDLAFLAVKTTLPALRLSSKLNYKKGEDVTVIGNPGLGGETVLENAISRGVMSTKTTLNGQEFYQLNIAINPGNSGGPVFDPTGRVIGVATLKATKEGVAFCIPVEDIRTALDNVATQSPQAAAASRGRHRMIAVFKTLTTGGGLYALALDIHFVVMKNSPQTFATDEKLRDFRNKLTEAEKEILTDAKSEAIAVRDDVSLPRDQRDQIDQLMKSFVNLQRAYQRGQQVPTLDQIRFMKSRHKMLVQDLQRKLQVDVPQEMLALLDDRVQVNANPQVVLGQAPFGAIPRIARPPMMPRNPMVPRPGGLRPGFNRTRPGNRF